MKPTAAGPGASPEMPRCQIATPLKIARSMGNTNRLHIFGCVVWPNVMVCSQPKTNLTWPPVSGFPRTSFWPKKPCGKIQTHIQFAHLYVLWCRNNEIISRTKMLCLTWPPVSGLPRTSFWPKKPCGDRIATEHTMGILDRHSDSVSADGACSHRHHQELVGPVPGMQAGVMGLPRMIGKC